MGEKTEEKGIVRGVLGETGGLLKKDASEKIRAAVLTLLSAAAGSTAKWVHGLTDLWRGILYGAAGLFLLLAVIIFAAGYYRYRKLRTPAKEKDLVPQEPSGRAFNSDDLEWKTLPPGHDWRIIVNITSDRPLPQPLEVRLQCSDPPTEARVSLYLDRARWGSEGTIAEPPAKIQGTDVLFELVEPRFKPPAMLSVYLIGSPGQQIIVNRVGWRMLK